MTDFSKFSTEELMAIAIGAKSQWPQEKPQIETPSPMVKMGRGMQDVYQGAKQKYLNWTDPAAAKTYTQDVNKDIALYERGRAAAGETGLDGWRLGGAITTPLSLLPGGGKTMGARAAIGVGTGGAAGYGLFNPENTETSNLMNTGVGAVTGGLLNVAAPKIIDTAIQGGQALYNKAGEMLRRGAQSIAPQNQITNNVKIALRNSGIDFSKLSSSVQKSIMDDATEQLALTGKLSAEQLLRKADIETVAGKGMFTKGQVTRDPAQWTSERNLQKIEMNLPAVQRGEVPSITTRLGGQLNAAERFANSIADDITTSGSKKGIQYTQSPNAFQASTRAIEAIKKTDKDWGDAVSNMYDAFRKTGNLNANVPDVKIADALGRVIDDFGVENIPAPVLSRLKEFGFLSGARTKQLTVQEADKLSRLINNNNPGRGTPGAKALQPIKEAIDASLLDVPDGGSKLLFDARRAAAARFKSREAGKGISRALDDVAPDKFLENNVIRGDVRDVDALKQRLNTTNPEIWADLKAQTVKWIVDKSKTNQGLSGSNLAKTLDSIGDEKLRTIFSQEELAKINTLRRGLTSMTVEPPFAAPNRSNTTPALMGQLIRAGNRIPFANIVTEPITKEIENTATQKLIQSALDGSGLNTAARDAAQQAFRNRVGGILGNRPGNVGLLGPLAIEQYRQ